MLPIAILAGGLATRLLPLTERLPKSLIEIDGRPFILHQLELLRRQGMSRVVLCVADLGDMIRDVVGDGTAVGLEVKYSWDGPLALGTAGALRKAIPQLGETFFAMYGDSYLPCRYKPIEAAFRSSGKLALMTVFHNAGQWDRSNVEFGQGRVIAYDKQHRSARMNYIDYGLGVFTSSVFNALPDNACDLATVYQGLLLEDELAAVEVAERFYEAGSFEGLRSLSDHLAGTNREQAGQDG